MEKRKSYLINKAFNGFLIASLLTVAATQLAATVDGMMLSYLVDEQAMSSVNICRPVMQLLFALSMLLGAGSSMLVGVAIGNHRRDEANRTFTAVMTVTVGVGLLFLLLGLGCLEPLVAFLCPDVQLQSVTSEYLGITLYGAVFYMLSVMLEMFVAVDGSPKRVTLAVLACSITNIVLDYVFIGLLGWGVSGAAWATITSYVVSVLFLLPHFWRTGALRLGFRQCFSTLGKSLSAGLPFGLATTLIAVQMWGNNSIAMTYLGQGGIVALSVCIYLLCLSMIILTGTLKALQPVASILKGAGDGRGVLMVIHKAYRFMLLSLFVFVLPLVLCPRWVAMVFGISEASMLDATAAAIPAFSLNIVFQCVVYLLIPIYQLYDNKALANFISVGQSLTPMLGMWILAVVAPDYVWWGFALGQAVVAICLLGWVAVVRVRNKQLLPLFLIPVVRDAVGFETSIPADLSKMDALVLEVGSYLKAHLSDVRMWNQASADRLQNHVEVCSEELLKNAIQHGMAKDGKQRFIDYRLTLQEDNVKVVISDDGKAFNPVECDPQTGYGLLLAKGMCDEMKYDYLFQQNMTTVIFSKR